jgi:uncharacterized membrane protein YjgN (DUF898 family)
MSIDQTTPAGGETLRLEQRARLGGYLGLSLKNGLLNLITLTLYRFWGKTEVRRRVWSSTYLNDEPFEYTGRGKELFVGFLIALAVVGLPYLLVVYAAQMLGPVLAAAIILPIYILMIFLFGFGLFTAFRYMASRTVWRGVRFRLRGSAVDYGLRILAYSMLSAVTLGWFGPTMRRKMGKHLWRNLSFGDRDFRFDEDASRREKIYPAFALAWIGTLVVYLVVIVVAIGVSYQMKTTGRTETPAEGVGAILVLVLLAVPFLIIVYSAFQAAILRSIVAGIVFEEARFRIRVRWFNMLWMTFSNIALIVFSLGFLMPFVQARTAKFLINRVTADGVAGLSTVRQTEHGPKTGEGLADAFGISPI